MTDSLKLCGLQSTRLFCPWDSPGKGTGVCCHFLLQDIFPTQVSKLCLFCLPPASVGRFFTTSPTWEAPTEHKLPTIVFTFLITSLFFVNGVTCFIETFTYFANTFVLVSSPPPPEGFPGGTGAKNLPANAENARDTDLIPGSGRSPAVGNSNQLQYSCLENSTVRGVLQDMSVVSQRVGDDWAHTHASQPASWQ